MKNHLKVGILTVHKSKVSYGGSLQAFSLWSFINSMGYTCEIIDLYRPVIKGYVHKVSCLNDILVKTKQNNPLFKRTIKNCIVLYKKLPYLKKHKLKSIRFQSFNSKISYSQSFKSIDSLYQHPPNYDVYIAGSDQIWNPDMPFENEPYLLSFVKGSARRISYASSFGRDNLPEIISKYYAKYLKKFNAISVREDTGCNLVEQMIGIRPMLTLDPTMLFNRDFWTLEAIDSDIKEEYLFCFMLNFDNEIISYAAEICKKKNLVLVLCLSSFFKYSNNSVRVVDATDSGPKEWLGWIKNAKFVLTDSFHGTVFSILFEQPFIAYVKDNKSISNKSSRIASLLNLLSLQSCYYNTLSFMDINLEIDYSKVNVKLKKHRDNSKDYLITALSK